MKSRALVLAFSVLPVATLLEAQGLAIDHKSVGCVVAGKHPRMNACFAPVSQLARARVYFRASNGGADWYYVEMKSDAPCHSGVLPKPKKALVGQTLDYYVDAADRGFAEARTEEYHPRIVQKASECDPKLLVAPALNSAAVAVFPAMPAGFAGAGLGLATTAAIVGGGVAAATGGAVAATGGGGSSSNTTQPTLVPVDTTLVHTTTTLAATTTTTTQLEGLTAVFKVLKAGVQVGPDSVSALGPLDLTFDMCESHGPYALSFEVAVDGTKLTAGCRSNVTFTMSGAVASSGRTPGRVSASDKTFEVWMLMHSSAPGNLPQASHKVVVTVIAAPTTTTTTTTTTTMAPDPCLTDKTGPTLSLTMTPTPMFTIPPPYPIYFTTPDVTDASTGNNGIALVRYTVRSLDTFYPLPDLTLTPTSGSVPYPYSWTAAQAPSWFGSVCAVVYSDVRAYAEDTCKNGTTSAPITVWLQNPSPSCLLGDAASGDRASRARALPEAGAAGTLLSDLDVPGGSGQVVLGGTAVFPRSGRSPLAVRFRRGVNHVEATLVEGTSPGTWRFELGGLPGLQPGSLRVIAGDAVQTSGDALGFRVQGRSGERIVFSFDVR